MTLRSDNRPTLRPTSTGLDQNSPSEERNRALNFDLTAELAYFRSRIAHNRLTGRPATVLHISAPYRRSLLHAEGCTAHHQVQPESGQTRRATLDDSPFQGASKLQSRRRACSWSVPSLLPGKSLVHAPSSQGSTTCACRTTPRTNCLDSTPCLPQLQLQLAQLFRARTGFPVVTELVTPTSSLLALTSRLIDDRGGELARASIGQIRHFRRPQGDTPWRRAGDDGRIRSRGGDRGAARAGMAPAGRRPIRHRRRSDRERAR